jgi:hypothetical protein
VDYDCLKNDARTDSDQSETGDDFRVSYESQSYVYFLLAPNGLVKIGFASDYDERIRKLRTGSPLPLYPMAAVRGGRVEEREYHKRFKAARHHGEWFDLTDEIEAEIDRLGRESNHLYRPYYQRGYAFPLTLTNTLPQPKVQP